MRRRRIARLVEFPLISLAIVARTVYAGGVLSLLAAATVHDTGVGQRGVGEPLRCDGRVHEVIKIGNLIREAVHSHIAFARCVDGGQSVVFDCKSALLGNLSGNVLAKTSAGSFTTRGQVTWGNPFLLFFQQHLSFEFSVENQ